MWRILFTLLAAATLTAMIANTIRIDSLREEMHTGRATKAAAIESVVTEAESLLLDDETTLEKKFPKKSYWLHVGIPTAKETNVGPEYEQVEIKKETKGTDHDIFTTEAGTVKSYFYRPGQNIIYVGFCGPTSILKLKPMYANVTEKFAPQGLTTSGVMMTVVGLPDMKFSKKFSTRT